MNAESQRRSVESHRALLNQLVCCCTDAVCPRRDEVNAAISDITAHATTAVLEQVAAIAESPDDRQEWESEDGVVREVDVIDAARLRALVEKGGESGV